MASENFHRPFSFYILTKTMTINLKKMLQEILFQQIKCTISLFNFRFTTDHQSFKASSQMSMFTNISDSTYIDISSATVHKINMQKPLLVSAYNNITHQDICNPNKKLSDLDYFFI